MFKLNRVIALFTLIIVLAFIAFEASPDSREISYFDKHSSLNNFDYVGSLDRLQVLFTGNDGTVYGMEDHIVFSSKDGGKSFQQIGRLPKIDGNLATRLKDQFARLRTTRLIRGNRGPNNLVVLNSGTILIFLDHIYRSADGGKTFQSVYEFSANGIEVPFSYSEGITISGDGTVYFGEYTTTARPHIVRILAGSDDGTKWDVVHTFDSGEIFHVHSIQYDPFRDLMWICTGDKEQEPGLYYTKDSFKSLVRLGSSTQDWRIVSLLVTEDYLYWGTDNPENGASIFRLDVETKTLEKIIDIGKVVYFSTILSDGTLVMSTTYEPVSKYILDNRPPATTDLWASKDGATWEKVLSLAHDGGTTQHGPSRAAMAFPGGKAVPDLFLMPLYTAPGEFATRVYRPNWN